MKFGIALPQGTMMEFAGISDPIEAYEKMTEVAVIAEEVGFESLWLSDVLWSDRENFLFECWTTMAALARDTSRIRLGQMVTNSGLRNPALLAKMASTIDVMSHGRLTVGIGSGFPPLASQFRAYGFDYPESAAVRARQLEEAIQILLALWTQEEATFEGTYYQVHGAINQPKGVQRPHIPLLIGGNGEKKTLKLVARYGDAWHVFGDAATLAHKFELLKQYCEEIGRDYASIRRAAVAVCVIADTDEQAQAKVPEAAKAFGGGLTGSPDTIRKQIAALEQAGVQELTLRFPVLQDLDGIRRFAREFIG
jgi:F420-dependent oxidoreductase-like protein